MSKLRYTIKVTEILKREVVVTAVNEGDAIEAVKERYHNEDIVLDSSDFVSVGFEVEEAKELCPHCETPLELKMIDIDGTNLEEQDICPECGYGTPALR